MSDADGIGTEGPWRIASEQQLRELLGRPLECPQPLSLSQERINRFAEVNDLVESNVNISSLLSNDEVFVKEICEVVGTTLVFFKFCCDIDS